MRTLISCQTHTTRILILKFCISDVLMVMTTWELWNRHDTMHWKLKKVAKYLCQRNTWECTEREVGVFNKVVIFANRLSICYWVLDGAPEAIMSLKRVNNKQQAQFDWNKQNNVKWNVYDEWKETSWKEGKWNLGSVSVFVKWSEMQWNAWSDAECVLYLKPNSICY